MEYESDRERASDANKQQQQQERSKPLACCSCLSSFCRSVVVSCISVFTDRFWPTHNNIGIIYAHGKGVRCRWSSALLAGLGLASHTREGILSCPVALLPPETFNSTNITTIARVKFHMFVIPNRRSINNHCALSRVVTNVLKTCDKFFTYYVLC